MREREKEGAEREAREGRGAHEGAIEGRKPTISSHHSQLPID